jgi:hypothetical protein
LKKKPNKTEENWKLTKVFKYFEKDIYAFEGRRALESAVNQLEEHDWNVDKATEDSRWFANRPNK